MASRRDGAIKGALIGLLLFTPLISEKAVEIINPIIPESWKILGGFSITVFAVGIGALIGYLTDK